MCRCRTARPAESISLSSQERTLLRNLSFSLSHRKVKRGGLSAAEILERTRGSVGWAAFYALFVLAVAVHAHSWWSWLEGMASPAGLVRSAAGLGRMRRCRR